MNIYTFYLFTNRCIVVERIDEPNRLVPYLHHHEIGPLNMPESSQFIIVKETIGNISSMSRIENWEDYHGNRDKIFNPPSSDAYINIRPQTTENRTCDIGQRDENGDIKNNLHEEF